MVDVPANLVDLPFKFIEEYMCPGVFLAIHVLLNVIGKSLDVLDVISQCHGITLKRTARKRTQPVATYKRASPYLEEMCAKKKTVAGASCTVSSQRRASIPTTETRMKGSR